MNEWQNAWSSEERGRCKRRRSVLFCQREELKPCGSVSSWLAHGGRPLASQIVAARIALPEVKRVVFKHEKQRLRCSRVSYNQSNSSLFTSQVDGITPASKLRALHLKSDNAHAVSVFGRSLSMLIYALHLHSALFECFYIRKNNKTQTFRLHWCDSQNKSTGNENGLDGDRRISVCYSKE